MAIPEDQRIIADLLISDIQYDAYFSSFEQLCSQLAASVPDFYYARALPLLQGGVSFKGLYRSLLHSPERDLTAIQAQGNALFGLCTGIMRDFATDKSPMAMRETPHFKLFSACSPIATAIAMWVCSFQGDGPMSKLECAEGATTFEARVTAMRAFYVTHQAAIDGRVANSAAVDADLQTLDQLTQNSSSMWGGAQQSSRGNDSANVSRGPSPAPGD
jgi:hypothetical protein